jgi:hypothetical protein
MPAWHCRQHRLDETDGNHRLLMEDMGTYGNIQKMGMFMEKSLNYGT